MNHPKDTALIAAFRNVETTVKTLAADSAISAERALNAAIVNADITWGFEEYTAETDSKARVTWLSSLKTIRALQTSVVIPGHSKVGALLDATTAVDFTENYLLVFEEELKKAKDPDSLINAMRGRFPSADLLLAIERGAKANVKP